MGVDMVCLAGLEFRKGRKNEAREGRCLQFNGAWLRVKRWGFKCTVSRVRFGYSRGFVQFEVVVVIRKGSCNLVIRFGDPNSW